VTRWIGPAVVERGEMDDEFIRPNIISMGSRPLKFYRR